MTRRERQDLALQQWSDEYELGYDIHTLSFKERAIVVRDYLTWRAVNESQGDLVEAGQGSQEPSLGDWVRDVLSGRR